MNLSRWDCKRDCGRREGALIAGLVSGLVSHTGGLFSGAELDTKRSCRGLDFSTLQHGWRNKVAQGPWTSVLHKDELVIDF